jgi:hypothetical protein
MKISISSKSTKIPEDERKRDPKTTITDLTLKFGQVLPRGDYEYFKPEGFRIRASHLYYLVQGHRSYGYTDDTTYNGHLFMSKETVLQILNDALAGGLVELTDIREVADVMATAIRVEKHMKRLRSRLGAKSVQRARKKPAEPPSPQ